MGTTKKACLTCGKLARRRFEKDTICGKCYREGKKRIGGRLGDNKVQISLGIALNITEAFMLGEMMKDNKIKNKSEQIRRCIRIAYFKHKEKIQELEVFHK